MRINYKAECERIMENIAALRMTLIGCISVSETMLEDENARSKEYVRGQIDALKLVKDWIEKDFGLGKEKENGDSPAKMAH